LSSLKTAAFSLIAGGIVLALLGLSAMSAASSDVSSFIEGASPDHTVWILLGGVALLCAGIGALFPAFRKRAE
jgi:branched-subunit amino acid permease